MSNATILVDGIRRPIENSCSQLIHPDPEGVINFWRWFGDSRLIDKRGRPLVLYHGTTADVSEFQKTIDIGFHFGSMAAANKRLQLNNKDSDEGASILPVYLNLRNPLRLPDLEDWYPDQILSVASYQGR